MDFILSDQVFLNGGKAATLTLSTDGILRWSDRGGILRCLSVEKEVLGLSTAGHLITIRALVEAGSDGGWCRRGGGSLVRKSFVFQAVSEDSLRNLCEKIQGYIDSLVFKFNNEIAKILGIELLKCAKILESLMAMSGRPKRLFIFVNPFGGRKSASKIFNYDVKPILEDANIEYTMQETKYQLHAKEVSRSLDLTKYDGIICVSGDGILVEVMNGLLEREDWATALKMPLGVIPADPSPGMSGLAVMIGYIGHLALKLNYMNVYGKGTGNGMIKSLLDSVGEPCTPAHAILAAIRGHKRSLDVATIWQGETRFFSVLMLAWGLIADIDIESEKYRWMGSARINFYALKRILRLREYNGSISFVPAPGFEDVGEPSGSCVDSMEPLKRCQHGYQGPKVDLESLNWRKLNGPFVSVWLHNVPWGAENTMAAPDAKAWCTMIILAYPFCRLIFQFGDGYLDLIVMRHCPKLALISLMSELDNGGHVKSPYVVYIKVKAVILEPGSRKDEPMKEGIIDSDGEVLARGKGTYKSNLKSLMVYKKLQVVVDQGLATLFTPI
ncbi:hypothetical protein OSB04_008255 [Centaurea solstitialis]|uniref:DAGKc domain-containing protein n=1 Tax=Centaurea solstitialis TaxID=347529 RepID=A0AA38TY40_9ASTR|nr:hypothetical protein OSB04_008255 [Centaurea solstitialis]